MHKCGIYLELIAWAPVRHEVMLLSVVRVAQIVHLHHLRLQVDVVEIDLTDDLVRQALQLVLQCHSCTGIDVHGCSESAITVMIAMSTNDVLLIEHMNNAFKQWMLRVHVCFTCMQARMCWRARRRCDVRDAGTQTHSPWRR